MPYQFSPQVEQWRSYIASKVSDPTLVDKILWVINYESGGNPGATGDNGRAIGLFQIHNNQSFPTRPTTDWLRDPINNINYALDVLGAGAGNFADWGQDNTYNGAAFGALGNHPFPGPTMATVQVPAGDIGTPINSGGGGVDFPIWPGGPSIPTPGGIGPEDVLPPIFDPRKWLDPRTWLDPTNYVPGGENLPSPSDVVNIPGYANIQSLIAAARTAIVWMLDPHHWARLGFYLVGGMMAVGGIWLIASSQGAAPSPAATARSIAPTAA
jgi:hypothetical protein